MGLYRKNANAPIAFRAVQDEPESNSQIRRIQGILVEIDAAFDLSVAGPAAGARVLAFADGARAA